MTNDACSICAGTMEGDLTTLECRHTFHVGCALHWFRYHNNTCPNCRSSRTHECWERKTPEERVSLLRRRRRHTPEVARLLKRLATVADTEKTLRSQHRAYRAEHATVLKTLRSYHVRTVKCRMRRYDLVREIDRACHTVPRMTLTGFAVEDEDSEGYDD